MPARTLKEVGHGRPSTDGCSGFRDRSHRSTARCSAGLAEREERRLDDVRRAPAPVHELESPLRVLRLDQQVVRSAGRDSSRSTTSSATVRSPAVNGSMLRAEATAGRPVRAVVHDSRPGSCGSTRGPVSLISARLFSPSGCWRRWFPGTTTMSRRCRTAAGREKPQPVPDDRAADVAFQVLFSTSRA